MPRDKDFWHIDWEEEFSDELTELQLEALDKVAKEVVDRQMAVPVVMFLESIRPMNWMASQLMLFLEPFYAWILGFKQLIDLRRALQKRESIGILIEKIEQYERERQEKLRSKRAGKSGFFRRLWRKITGGKNETGGDIDDNSP